MYLVDTSIWIDYIKGKDKPYVMFLDALLANPLAIGLTKLIYMEILQGSKNQAAFDRFSSYFSGQKFYTLQQGKDSYAAAAQMYFDCRRQGITIRSSLDCLIAQCAIENDLILLHNDRDFCQIANVIKGLNQKSFL